MKFVLIILAALLLSAASQARGSELAGIQFTEARAYFVGWSLLTRVPLGIDDVIDELSSVSEFPSLPGAISNKIETIEKGFFYRLRPGRIRREELYPIRVQGDHITGFLDQFDHEAGVARIFVFPLLHVRQA